MELFDFIKALFERPNDYAKLKDYEKAKFFFMCQRFFSIAYPVQAQAFNHIKVPQARVLDYWQRNLTKIYTKVPDWIYTKTKKTVKETKVKAPPSDEAIRMYLEKNKYSMRQLEDAVAIFGREQVYAPMYKIDKLLGSD